MADHENTTPPSVANVPPLESGGTSRRALAGALGALTALLATTATAASSAAKSERERLATLEDYATAEFEGWPASCIDDLGPREQWMEAAADHWVVLRIAMETMQYGHQETAEKAGQGPELFVEFVEQMGSVEDTFRKFADFLGSAQVRVMAGLARHAVSVGEA